MNQEILFTSLIWLALIALFEFKRSHAYYPFDFLLFVNILVVVNFVIPPVAINLFPHYRSGIEFIFNGDYSPRDAMLYTTIVAMAGHGAIIAGYMALKRNTRAQTVFSGGFSNLASYLSGRDISKIALAVGAFGIGAFYVYAQSLGGFETMWKQSYQIRGSYVIAKFGFLKIIATLLVPVFYLALSRLFDVDGSQKLWWLAISAVFGTLGFVLLYHDGSRVFLMVFLLTPLLAFFAHRGHGFYKFLPLLAGLAIVYYLVADEVFLTIFHAQHGMISELKLIFNDAKETFVPRIFALGSGFGFPYFVLNEYLVQVPEFIDYRYLYDLYSGFIILMPSVLVGTDPEYILDINAAVFQAEIPIDILSMGYVSAGVMGMVLLAGLFGAVLAYCDMVFANAKTFFDYIVMAWFLLQVPWLIMYGDPVNAVKRLFATGVVTFIIIIVAILRKRSASRVGELTT